VNFTAEIGAYPGKLDVAQKTDGLIGTRGMPQDGLVVKTIFHCISRLNQREKIALDGSALGKAHVIPPAFAGFDGLENFGGIQLKAFGVVQATPVSRVRQPKNNRKQTQIYREFQKKIAAGTGLGSSMALEFHA
jgi:hypothetical protein